MKPLAFVGRLSASKSILNRLLIAQSYKPELRVEGDSACEDVRLLRQAVEDLASGRDIHCGEGGTVLRFMAFRASRVPGRHRLIARPRLLARPREELIKVLHQLGVTVRELSDGMELESEGWRLHGDTLLVPFARSSQFASGLLLNSWDLPFDMYVSLGGQKVSEGYWRMTHQLMRDLGMRIDFWDSDFRVPKGQRVQADVMQAETDASSAFALAAVAAVNGRVSILDFPLSQMQPDTAFVSILRTMGVPVGLTGSTLTIEKTARLQPVAVSLNQSPDLFPVLAALCALAPGRSDLYGAPQLAYKESHRIARMAEWISRFGRQVTEKPDGLVIEGEVPSRVKLSLDAGDDHRLAFAAAVWKAAGHEIEILNRESVNKSFPEFWSILGW